MATTKIKIKRRVTLGMTAIAGVQIAILVYRLLVQDPGLQITAFLVLGFGFAAHLLLALYAFYAGRKGKG
jgi:hypothetical protein